MWNQATQEKRGTEEGILNFEHKPFQFPEKLIHIGSAQYWHRYKTRDNTQNIIHNSHWSFLVSKQQQLPGAHTTPSDNDFWCWSPLKTKLHWFWWRHKRLTEGAWSHHRLLAKFSLFHHPPKVSYSMVSKKVVVSKLVKRLERKGFSPFTHPVLHHSHIQFLVSISAWEKQERKRNGGKKRLPSSRNHWK